MENRDLIEDKAREIVEKFISDQNQNLELVDVEYIQDGGYYFLRIYIDKEDGINLDDCEILSKAIEEDIDKIIEDKFFLEVSSPGLERPLKKEKDFIRFKGEKAEIKLKHKMEDTKKIKGVIEKIENDELYIKVDEETVKIPFIEIKKANLVFEFGEKD